MAAAFLLTVPVLLAGPVAMPSSFEGAESFLDDPAPVCMVATLRVHDLGWVDGYNRYVPPLVQELGGRLIATTEELEALGGSTEPPDFVVIIEWPSRKAARDFHESSDYHPFRESRGAGASTELLLIDPERPSPQETER